MAIHAKSLAAYDVGVPDNSVVPFLIRCPVTATATTETIIQALPYNITVIDAWANVSTQGGAQEDWDVRTAAGEAGGTVIVSFLLDSGSVADGARIAPITVAGEVTEAPVALTTANGIFVDKTEANAGTGAGTIWLLCYKT